MPTNIEEIRESCIQEKVTQLEEQIQQYEFILAEQNKKILELQQQVKPESEILDRLTKLEQSFSTIQPITTDVTAQEENDLSSSTNTDYTLDKLLESIQSLTSTDFVPVRRRYSSSAAMRKRPGSRMSRVSSGRGSMFYEYEDIQDLLHNADMLEELEPSAQHVEPAKNFTSDDKIKISSSQQEQALSSVLLAMEDMLHSIKYYRTCKCND